MPSAALSRRILHLVVVIAILWSQIPVPIARAAVTPTKLPSGQQWPIAADSARGSTGQLTIPSVPGMTWPQPVVTGTVPIVATPATATPSPSPTQRAVAPTATASRTPQQSTPSATATPAVTPRTAATGTPTRGASAVATPTGTPALSTSPTPYRWRPAQTDISGNITSDTVWTTSGSPYRLAADVTVANGATLTIQPGVVVQAGENVGLYVQPGSRLVVNGTTDSPIRFTASITNPQPNWWAGIQVLGNSSSANSSSFSYATIEYAGRQQSGYSRGSGDNAYPRASLALFRFGGTLNQLTIQHSGGDGLWLDSSSPPLAPGLNIRSNGGKGIVLLGETTFRADAMRVSANGRTGSMSVKARPVFGDFLAEGNTDPSIAIEGSAIYTDTTLPFLGVPWALGSTDIDSGATLTVDAGNTLLFAQDSQLTSKPGSRIAVNGTASSPVRFTANSITPQRNWWAGIQLLGDPGSPNTSSFSYAVVEYAGLQQTPYAGSAGGYIPKAALSAFRYGGLLNQVTIQRSGDDGLWLDASAPQIVEGLYIRNNAGRAIVLLANTTFSANNVQVVGNGRVGYMQSAARPAFANFSAADNADPTFLLDVATISNDTTWQFPGFNLAVGSISVNSGATLTITAGTTVRFNQYSQLKVNPGGRLIAEGTAQAPVRFTANTANPQPGWWRGIMILGDESNYNTSTVNYATVEYAGLGDSYNDGNWVEHNAALATNRFTGSLNHLTIQQSAGDGLWLDRTVPQPMVDINIRNNAGRGMVLLNSTRLAADRVEVSGNGKTGYMHSTIRPTFSNFNAEGNADPNFAIEAGNIGADTDWQNLGVPWAPGSISINSGITLTIQAGATLRFKQSSNLVSNPGSRLVVSGTADAPIRFTANITNPLPGWWRGIMLLGDESGYNSSSISYATVEYAGLGNSYYDGGWVEHTAALATNRFTGSLNHLTIQQNAGDGLWLDRTVPQPMTDITLRNNASRGLALFRWTALSADGVQIDDNGQTGYMDAIVRPVFSNFSAEGNTNPNFAIGAGTISTSTTWQYLGIPWAPGSIDLSSGVTLTIEAGSTVRFSQSSHLVSNANSRLIVNGTAQLPVRFTANANDPQPGSWRGIMLLGDPNSYNTSTIDYATVEYAGLGDSYYDGGWVEHNAALSANRFIGALNHLTIQRSGGDGLWLDRTVPQPMADLTIRSNAGRGFVLLRGTTFSADSVRVGGNGRTGYMQSTARPVFTNFAAEGDSDSTVGIEGGTIYTDTTWQLPGASLTIGSITISAGATLTIAEGTILRFDSAAHLVSNPGSRLVVSGTADAPVRFTARTANPQPGWWRGIMLLGDESDYNSSSISYATVEYAGLGNSYYDSGWVDHTASLAANRFNGALNHLTIQQNAGDGLWLDRTVPQPMTDITLRNNASRGLALFRWTTLSADGVQIDDNGQTGYMDAIVRPVFSNFSAEGNTNPNFAIGAGTISASTTWQYLGVPWAPGSIDLSSGVTLTIEAGSTVRFSQSSHLVSNANSRLIVNGTAQLPVRFTANANDPQPGSWRGIMLLGDPNSYNSSTINYATVEYAGLGDSYYDGGWVEHNAALAANRFVGALNHLTIQRSGGDGLWLDRTIPQPMADINIRNNLGRGLVLLRQTRIVADGVEVSGNGKTGYMHSVVRPGFTNFTAEGNADPSFAIEGGSIDADTTWQNLGVPWQPGSIAVSPGVTLTVEAGSVLRFSQNSRLLSGAGSRLVVSGTASAPVRFTANITNPQPGWWVGVMLLGEAGQPNTSSVDHAIVEYAGYPSSYYDVGWIDSRAGLTANRFYGGLNHLTVQHSGGDGLYLDLSSPQPMSGLAVLGNGGRGLTLLRQTVLFADGVRITGNGQTGYMHSVVRPTFANFVVEDNANPNFAVETGWITADTTWQNLGVPWAPGRVTIGAGATLTVEAGSEVRFNQNGYLLSDYGSRLVASGAASAPIHFTANITNPQPNWWGGLIFLGDQSRPNLSRIEHAIIEYAGYQTSYYRIGWVDTRAGLTALGLAGLLDDVTIQHGGYDGLWLDSSSLQPAASLSIRDNAGRAFVLINGSALSVEDVEVRNNGQTGFMHASARPLFGNFIAEGNTDPNFVIEGGAITTDTTWSNLGVPWVPGSVTVNSGASLTIEAGATVRFNQNAQLTSGPGSRLVVSGTMDSPIRFTANLTTPTPGWWSGIQIVGDGNSGNMSSFNYAIVEYAGNPQSNYGNGYPKAGIASYRWAGRLQHTIVQFTDGDGLWLDSNLGMALSALGIRSNSGTGVKVLRPWYGDTILTDSNLYKNLIANLDGSAIATNNYWGSKDGPGSTVKGGATVEPWRSWPAKIFGASIDITPPPTARGGFVRPGDTITLDGNEFDCAGSCQVMLYWDFVDPGQYLGEVAMGDNDNTFRTTLSVPGYAEPGPHDIVGVLLDSESEERNRGKGTVHVPLLLAAWPVEYPQQLITGTQVTITWVVTGNSLLDENRLVWDTVSHTNALSYSNQLPDRLGQPGTYSAQLTIPVDAKEIFYRIVARSGSDFYQSAEFGVGKGALTERDFGSLTIWADAFPEIDNKVYATGNVAIGANHRRYFSVAKPPGASDSEYELTIAGDAFSGTGTIAFANGMRRPLWTGPISGNGATGEIRPGETVSFTLTELMGRPLDLGGLSLTLNATNGWISGTSGLVVALPENVVTPTLDFALNQYDSINGTFTAMQLSAAGMALDIAGGTLERAGLRSPTATLTLPSYLGGGVAGISPSKVTRTGLRFDQAAFDLPAVNFGGPGALEGQEISARVVVNGNVYAVVGDGTLHVALPEGNTKDTDVAFQFQRDGNATKVSGYLKKLDFVVAGAPLSLSNLTVNNNGLQVGAAEMGLPQSIAMNPAQRVALSDVAITKAGLRIAGGSSAFALPDMTLGSGMHVTSVVGLLAVENEAYRLDISGTLHLSSPGNSLYTPTALAVRRAVTALGFRTDVTGTAASLAMSMAGGTLAMSNLALSNAGLRVATAILNLPTINIPGAALSDLAINTNGQLSIGSGSAPFNLPDFVFGSSGTALGMTGAKGNLFVTENKYALSISGNFTATLPGNNLSVATTFTVHPDGSVAGNVSRLAANMAGGTLVMRNISLSSAGLQVANASLSLPTINVLNATVNNVAITTGGALSIGGGSATFAIPDFIVGSSGTALSVKNARATLTVDQGLYTFSLGGTFSASLLDATLTSAATLTINGDGTWLGNVSALTVSMAGGSLLMSNLALGSSGLRVATAELRLPSINIPGLTLNDVAVSTNGQFSIGGGGATFNLPDFTFGSSGTSLRLTGSVATLVAKQNKYALSISGTFAAELPGNSLTVAGTTITVNGDGTVVGSVKRLTVSMAGGSLDMSNLTLSSSGLRVANANLSLPTFPVASLTLTDVAISTAGQLTIGGSGATFRLPDFIVGSSGTSLSVKGAVATLSVDQGKYVFMVSGTFSASLLDSILTSSATIRIGSDGTWAGTISTLTVSMAGGSLVMANLTLGSAGLSVASAELKLPQLNIPSLALYDVAINTRGQLTVGGGSVTFNLPEFTFGASGTALRMISPKATLVVRQNKYALSINGTFAAELPGNSLRAENTTITVSGDGAVTGTVGRLTVAMVGGTLDMKDLALDSAGLRVGNASLNLPTFPVQNLTLTDVAIGTDGGISIGGGGARFRVPDFYFGYTGSSLSMKNGWATIGVQNNLYSIGVSGTFVAVILDATLTSNASLSLSSDGTLTGSVDSLSISVAGIGSLSMSNLAITGSGLTVSSGSISLPQVNISNAEVRDLAISLSGQLTKIGGGGLAFDLPNLSFGYAGSSLGMANARASLGADGGRFVVSIGGTFTAALPDNALSAAGNVYLDGAGRLGGSVQGLNLSLPGGLAINWSGSQIEASGGLYVQSASLQLPAALGGLSTGITGLRISPGGGLSVEGGEFALPAIDTGIGGFRIRDAKGSFKTSEVGGRRYYEIGGGGVFAIDGAAELTVSFTIGYNDYGSLALKNACLGIRSLNPAFPGVPIPPPQSPVYLTGVSGCVELKPDVTVFNLTVTLEVEPRARIGGYSALWGTIGATYRTAGDPAISLAGTINAFSFRLAEASIDIARSRPDFRIEAKITLGSIVEGGVRVHLWYVDSIHMTGSIWATIHLGNIPLPDWAGWMRVFLKGDTGASLDFGEFRRSGGGTTWGIKYILKWGDAVVGSVFWGLDGGPSVNGGAGDTRLVDQFALNAPGMRLAGVVDGMPYTSQVEPGGITSQIFTRTITSTTPLVVSLGWKAGQPNLAVYRPNGQQVVSDTVQVLHDLSAGTETYAIQNPAVGAWTFVVGKLEGNENYRLETTSFYQTRLISSAAVTNGSTPSVSWTLTEGSNTPTVSVWVDTDSQHFDGQLLADSLSGGNANLDTSALTNGTYYVYLRLDDGGNGVDKRYATGTLTVQNDVPPAVPGQFSARPVAQGVELTWRPPVENDLAGYNLGFGAGPSYSDTITLGVLRPDDSGLVRHLLQRQPGSTTQVAIRSYDISRNYSAWSNPVTATVPVFAIQSISPGSGSLNVGRTGSFTVTFNSPLDPTSVVTSNLRLRDNTGSIPLSLSPLRSEISPSLTIGIVATPQSLLAEGGAYALIVAGGLGGVRSETGGTLADSASVAFTTEASPPAPAFSIPGEIEVGQVMTPTNTTTGAGQISYLWSFGDGTTSDSIAPTHVYNSAGTYTVTLTASNVGGSATVSRAVTVTEPLPALTVAKVGRLAVDADGTGQLSPGDTIEWTITITNSGEGALQPWVLTDTLDVNTTLVVTSAVTTRGRVTASGNGVVVSHSGLLAGDRAVITLQARVKTDVADSVTTISNQALLSAGNYATTPSDDPLTPAAGDTTLLALGSPPPPLAGFTAPSNITVNQIFTPTNTTTGAGQIQYLWSFGDGTTSTAITPTHQYTSTGTFTIDLAATNLGGSSTFTRTIRVLEPNAIIPRVYLPVVLRSYVGGW